MGLDPKVPEGADTMTCPKSAVVAGHLCLDIFPSLDHLASGQFDILFKPGRLIQVGAAQFSTGGPVSNTGLALHRLGVPTRLIAKVGSDPFGQVVRDLVSRHDTRLAKGITVDPTATTSYTVIISPPGMDRIFLHCPGANDTFSSTDVAYDLVTEAALFHFGYPPLMQRMYIEAGRGLVEVLSRAKATGVTTSLDMSFPDPSSEGGRIDWRVLFKAVLPYVDVFLPSIEELLFTLRPKTYKQLHARGPLLHQATPALLADLGRELMDMGVKVVVLKLGDHGLYLYTSGEDRLESLGRARPIEWRQWTNREIWAPCFQVNAVGTTGAGDATIAGFLAALLRGLSPEQAMTMAVAVGACNVEAADALSGLRTWEATEERVATGWPRHVQDIRAPGWRWEEHEALWFGPANP
jgi:sugar/nucleoside kinase (ribokinase family)